jgi:hypothetical protein
MLALLPFSPAQNAPLAITNDRLTIGGEFSPARPNNKYLPGDRFFLAFDIENLRLTDDGKGSFLIGMTVTNSSGRIVYENKPARQDVLLPLGGSKLPGRAFVDTASDMTPGQYKCEVLIRDLATNESKTLQRTFEMLPKAFGLVAMYCSGDDKGDVPAPFSGIAGQALWLHFFAVGFDRRLTTKQPDLEITFRALDSTGKPTLLKPRVEVVDDNIPEKEPRIPISLSLPMNRTGTYSVEIIGKDRVSGQSDKLTFQVVVHPAVK